VWCGGKTVPAIIITLPRTDSRSAVKAPAIRLLRSFGFEILATVPEAFHHPAYGYVGLHIMYRPL
jgi:hypothetical protein